MADPTFNGVTLCTRAARCEIDSPQVRWWSDTLPGVDGDYLTLAGRGGRRLVVHGLLGAAGATPAAARSALAGAIAQRQALADGATVAAFRATDGTQHPLCLLTAYRHGPLSITREGDGAGGGVCTALAAVRAELREIAP